MSEELFYATASLSDRTHQQNRILAAIGEGVIRALLRDPGLCAEDSTVECSRILHDYRKAIDAVLNPPSPPNTCWCGAVIPDGDVQCELHHRETDAQLAADPLTEAF